MQLRVELKTGLSNFFGRVTRSLGLGTLTNTNWWGLGSSSSSGETVNRESAMRVGAVYACVKVISEAVAATPQELLQRLDLGGVQMAINRPEFSLIHNSPRANMTAYTFWQCITVDVLLDGNGYALIVRDPNNGLPTELRYYPVSETTVYKDYNDVLTYRFKGRPGVYLEEEVLHFKNLGFDGLIGKSVISLHAETIGNSLSASKMQGRQFKNGTTTGAGWYEAPQGVNTEKARETSELIQERYAGENRFKAMVLPYGVKFHGVGISQRDAQFIETMQYNTEDIAGLFNAPLYKIKRNTNMSKASIEQQNIEFVTDTLHPLLTNFNQELDLKLFGPENRTYFTQPNLEALRRGDLQTMTDHYMKMIYSGVFSVNQVRQKMGLNPREGGDDFLQPTNTYNLAQLMAELDKKQAEAQKLIAQAEEIEDKD